MRYSCILLVFLMYMCHHTRFREPKIQNLSTIVTRRIIQTLEKAKI
jgi:hypothetical protein